MQCFLWTHFILIPLVAFDVYFLIFPNSYIQYI